MFVLFVWGGQKVLSTNVLHNLYQKQINKNCVRARERKGRESERDRERKTEKSRGSLILMAQVTTQYVKQPERCLTTALPLYYVPEYK